MGIPRSGSDDYAPELSGVKFKGSVLYISLGEEKFCGMLDLGYLIPYEVDFAFPTTPQLFDHLIFPANLLFGLEIKTFNLRNLGHGIMIPTTEAQTKFYATEGLELEAAVWEDSSWFPTEK